MTRRDLSRPQAPVDRSPHADRLERERAESIAVARGTLYGIGLGLLLWIAPIGIIIAIVYFIAGASRRRASSSPPGSGHPFSTTCHPGAAYETFGSDVDVNIHTPSWRTDASRAIGDR
jgi:hypothetical protein